MAGIREERSGLRLVSKPASELTGSELRQCYVLVRRIKWLYIGAGLPWSPREKAVEMRDTENLDYVLMIGPRGSVEAFISYVLDDEDDAGRPTTFIYEIHVHPRHQGKGLGRRLLEQVSSRASHGMTLRVFPSNQKAVSFYEAMGFHKDIPFCDDEVWYMCRSHAA